MKKSGLIAGGIAFLFSFGSAVIISPICVPCLALAFGILGGYLAGVYDKPGEQNSSTKAGALAGLLTGGGMLIGQILGAVFNGVVLGPEGTARILAQMGFPAGGPAQIAEFYWTVLVISTTCLGVFDLALTSSFGALGGLLWWKTSGEKQNVPNRIIGI